MLRILACALAASTFTTLSAVAEPLRLDPARYGDPPDARSAEPARVASMRGGGLGGGFIEFIFGGGAASAPPSYAPQQTSVSPRYLPHEAPLPEMDPEFLPRVVRYDGPEKPGTIVVDTPRHFLYLVQTDGTARRYGIGVGRPGFTWAGVKEVSAKREWPDWRPPPEMLRRRPDLPTFMAGGPENPLGARALYLGSSLYRIHGSNEPWTIGTNVSSGCIRMRNEDVIDLYERVKVGTKVVVI
jgi:lipoprotein-anchoring transpeptidase ErfK/SrfK